MLIDFVENRNDSYSYDWHSLNPMTLDQLTTGSTARIHSLASEDVELQARIRAMGLCPGRLITLIRRSRFGGPLQVRVGTTDLILRPAQAQQILLEHAQDQTQQVSK